MSKGTDRYGRKPDGISNESWEKAQKAGKTLTPEQNKEVAKRLESLGKIQAQDAKEVPTPGIGARHYGGGATSGDPFMKPNQGRDSKGPYRG